MKRACDISPSSTGCVARDAPLSSSRIPASGRKAIHRLQNEDYLQNGASLVEVFDRDKAIQFVDYHWNLSTMLKQSREVGFRMLALAVLPDAPGDNPRGAPGLCFEFDKA